MEKIIIVSSMFIGSCIIFASTLILIEIETVSDFVMLISIVSGVLVLYSLIQMFIFLTNTKLRNEVNKQS